jgi:hypothetical protein
MGRASWAKFGREGRSDSQSLSRGPSCAAHRMRSYPKADSCNTSCLATPHSSEIAQSECAKHYRKFLFSIPVLDQWSRLLQHASQIRLTKGKQLKSRSDATKLLTNRCGTKQCMLWTDSPEM